jgi:Flp pilus assembly pilin Flp
MRKLLSRLRREDEAATAVEYAIIAAIVGVSLIGVLLLFSDELSSVFRRIVDALGGA